MNCILKNISECSTFGCYETENRKVNCDPAVVF